jgi:hypothetical protein
MSATRRTTDAHEDTETGHDSLHHHHPGSDAVRGSGHTRHRRGKQIAEEAFIYGLPIVMNYAVMYEYAKDGSLDVYVQKDSPGKDKEANWLPAAAEGFSITLRVYWPKPAMLDGGWTPLPVKRIN